MEYDIVMMDGDVRLVCYPTIDHLWMGEERVLDDSKSHPFNSNALITIKFAKYDLPFVEKIITEMRREESSPRVYMRLEEQLYIACLFHLHISATQALEYFPVMQEETRNKFLEDFREDPIQLLMPIEGRFRRLGVDRFFRCYETNQSFSLVVGEYVTDKHIHVVDIFPCMTYFQGFPAYNYCWDFTHYC